MTKLSTLLDQIDSGTILLPEFQRGYVWNRDQVRGLMRSLYLGYPVGSLLTWETEADAADVRGPATGGGPRLLLLDGQQRITSLYGIIRGRPPAFFDGNPAAFSGLHFDVEDEVFEFYAPAKMKDNPRWIDVTELFRHDLGGAIDSLMTQSSDKQTFGMLVQRLSKLYDLLYREFHEEKITGADKTSEVVVDIFNRVNSGGTKLSQGDLALAKICARWPAGRRELRGHLDHWRESGYDFSLDWLLRNATAVATGRARFTALDSVSTSQFEQSLAATGGYVGHALDTLRGQLGLDHDRVLLGRFGIPIMCRWLHGNGGHFTDAAEQNRWLYWYIHAGLWGRYAGSTESVLARDLELLDEQGLEGPLSELRRARGGSLRIAPVDFASSTMGSRFYPMLYLMTRVLRARDLLSGIPLSHGMLGNLGSLQVHHIFPKALLRDYGYDRGEVNAVANFAFLTQESNLKISCRHPAEYLAEIQRTQPAALPSQWIPTDPELWALERYPDFLAARQALLAEAANRFLDGLASSIRPAAARPDLIPLQAASSAESESRDLSGLIRTLLDMGCAEPMTDSEIADPSTGETLAMAEAYWPDGIQVGQGEPVILELDPDVSALASMQRLGYEVFTSEQALLEYVRRRNAEAAGLVRSGSASAA